MEVICIFIVPFSVWGEEKVYFLEWILVFLFFLQSYFALTSLLSFVRVVIFMCTIPGFIFVAFRV